MGTVAYFSMEIGVDPRLPTYSGGLGMLAGDSLRSAADLALPIVAVSLLPRKGYFSQSLDAQGRQVESPAQWSVEESLQPNAARTSVTLEGRTVAIRAWTYTVRGAADASAGRPAGAIPVYFLDTDLDENDPRDRELSHWLYGGDQRYRLCQEVVLGVGGVRMLRALGHTDIVRYHMNEGHAALLAGELLRQRLMREERTKVEASDVDAVRRLCVFTTHTPVPAGHDRFPLDMVRSVIGAHPALEESGLFTLDGHLHMTHAALNLSHFVNGVAKKHGEVSRGMFPNHRIESITNGAHLATWASPEMRALFDARIPGWRADNFSLRGAMLLQGYELWDAHVAAKKRLAEMVETRTGAALDPNAFTIGFARRSTAYKRPDLLLSDMTRLRTIAHTRGPIQILYAGKAHPRDTQGKELIARIISIAKQEIDGAGVGGTGVSNVSSGGSTIEGKADGRDARPTVAASAEPGAPKLRIVYVPNYDFEMCRLMVAGCDLWLNTPEPPLEASGTSGMKAAVNGVPQLSILDGWWIEGWLEDVTGWAIDGMPGSQAPGVDRRGPDATSLYEQLEAKIIPMFYHDREGWTRVMRHAIALNASFFNTQRMMQEYVLKAYFP